MARAPRRHPPAVALTSVDISDNGTPLLSFSDGRAYTYHSKLRTWLRLVNPQDHRASDFHIHPPGSAPILSKQQQQQQQQTKANSTLLAFARTTESPLDYLQELGYRQHQATEKANASKRGNSSAERLELVKNAGVRRLVTLDHLESLVRTADIIGSSDDVLRYSDSLARALARGGDTSRVSHWLTDLLGPPLAKGLCPPAEPSMLADAARWNPCLASVPKRQILERILPVLATNRHLQALVTEYSKALESLL
ncbi:HIR complex subunit [Coemansia sp. Benny D115]|nr:HIR complex subunit [Coemansia sp. Benny D115]